MSEPLKTAQQLLLEIADARTGEDGKPQTAGQLIDYIIDLYGAEFEKANVEIARLREGKQSTYWQRIAEAHGCPTLTEAFVELVNLRGADREWFTTADEDGDCAIFDKDKKLVGVGATPVQTLALVSEHNGMRTKYRGLLEEEAKLWDKIVHVDLTDDFMGDYGAQEHAKWLRSK